MPFLSNPFSLKSDAFLKFLLYLGFLFSGIVTVFIGQILPILSERLSLNDTEAGYFFIAQCVGSITGTFSTQYLVRKFGFQMATVIGIFQMGVGVFGLNSDLWIVCLAAFFLI